MSGRDAGGPGEQRDDAADLRDRAGEDRDHAGEERDEAGDLRDRAAHTRDHLGDHRDHVGNERDEAGDLRDQAADLRDQAAELRDHAAELRDRAAELADALMGANLTTDALNHLTRARHDALFDRQRASQDRTAGAGERADAGRDRDTALTDRTAGAGERADARFDRDTAQADRTAGAGERTGSGLDRDEAQSDRTAAASDRDIALSDDVTSVYLRGPGFAELAREIARVQRTHEPLVLAFVDVDGLKSINDSQGHAAGDQLLRAVADMLRGSLRPYDLIIRYGGDEFVCVMTGLNRFEASERLSSVNAVLAEAFDRSVTVGIAELQENESLQDLVARADAALYREREGHRHSRS